MFELKEIERERQTLQAKLDSLKTQKERNLLGQFSTPINLAYDIFKSTLTKIPKNEKIRFLDPAFGTGAFFSALVNATSLEKIEVCKGFEVDRHYGEPTKQLWRKTFLDLQLSDFTEGLAPSNEYDKFNLIVCNPPYVRHHHINGKKEKLQAKTKESSKMQLSGLAGLYCYFIGLSHLWMKSNAIACWLIPSEFMDVNYGLEIKKYLLNEVTLLQIHRFNPDDSQFNDALVSSSIVWFKNQKPKKNIKVNFTYGNIISDPICEKKISSDVLENEPKWTRFPLLKNRNNNILAPKIKDFFLIKRGIATGNNSFFILSKNDIKKRNLPISQFCPILPSPRYLEEKEIEDDIDGNPKIKQQLFVLDSKLPISEIETSYPSLFKYLKEGIEQGVADRYLCKKRKIWYSQENREHSNFYCTYIGRTNGKNKKPFKFILNNSKAIVSNSYLILYPKQSIKEKIDKNPLLKKELIDALNHITEQAMLDEARVYGGGMYKLEPKELSNVTALKLAHILKKPNKLLNIDS